jgi:predicted DNA binding CopG/RHH family protein
MSARTKYAEEDIGSPRVTRDFLPSPEDLAFNDESVKVTIALSRRSVDFFKDQAKGYGTQYQRMIRRLLDAYVDSHAAAQSTRKSGKTRASR